jgi:thioredoxin-like negative regulator of GroEL
MLRGRDLGACIDEVDAAPMALMALGREVCPACQTLDASLAVLADARPDLPMYVVHMDGEDDWAVREALLWPRDIRVSRAATPAIALLRNGRAVATHQGALPAFQLDAWIAEWFGPAVSPVPRGIADAEQSVLDRTAARRAQHALVKDR